MAMRLLLNCTLWEVLCIKQEDVFELYLSDFGKGADACISMIYWELFNWLHTITLSTTTHPFNSIR